MKYVGFHAFEVRATDVVLCDLCGGRCRHTTLAMHRVLEIVVVCRRCLEEVIELKRQVAP